ncbi:glycosyltransferase family 4 protein [Gorillibacterium sp. sgz5001074]|uniref:glycosyltransferase family 4 protein n=1 Tax=Gorillibacterium sp. sgz5001074 TaxID=3446695 RepID=UPI003F66D790
MKLLFTFYIPSGGVETLNRERCRILMERGIDCHLLYHWPGDGVQNISGIPTHVTDDDAAIGHLLRTERFDAIIVNSNYLMLERIRRLGYGGTVIFEAQGLGTFERAAATLLEGLPYIHSCSQAVLYPDTGHMIGLFQSIYPGFRQFCFPNCMDTVRFSYRPAPALPYPVIGWVGRIETNKNWRGFLELGAAWLQQVPQARLWMFDDANIIEEGQGPHFYSAIQTLGLSHALVRRSNVPHSEMPTFYSQIGDSGGFLVSTSLTEGFGYAILEAMSCRCPVLSTDSDGPRSFITHNVTGKFYPVTDPNAGMLQGMELLNDAALRERLRDAGMAHVRSRYSPGAYADRFIAMLHELGVY